MAIFNIGSTRYAAASWRLDLARLSLHGPQQATAAWTGQQDTLTQGMPLQLARHDMLLRIHHPH